jgi:hypothetical protein
MAQNFLLSPSNFLICLFIIFANVISANANSVSAAVDHEHRLAAEIAALKKGLADSCKEDSIYPCNLAPTPMDEKICLIRLNWNKGVEKVVPSPHRAKSNPTNSNCFTAAQDKWFPSPSSACLT